MFLEERLREENVRLKQPVKVGGVKVVEITKYVGGLLALGSISFSFDQRVENDSSQMTNKKLCTCFGKKNVIDKWIIVSMFYIFDYR